MSVRDMVSGFLGTAERHSGRPALELKGVTRTYADLLARAEAIRRAVAAEDTGPLVGVFGDRATGAYESVLGVLLAGKGYVPLSPTLPDERLKRMAGTAGLRFVLAPKSAADRVARWGRPAPTFLDRDRGEERGGARPAVIRPDAVAYLHFTSGTTGDPKGVPGSHANAAAYLSCIVDDYAPRPDDRVSQGFDLGFDPAVHDMFFAWLGGGCLFPVPDEERLAPAGFIRRNALTAWYSVPSIAATMLRLRAIAPGAFPTLRASLFCGEVLPYRIARAWQRAAPASVVDNFYGPTETTICLTRYRFRDDPAADDDDGLPVGRPLAGHAVKILGDDGKPAAAGETGEIYLGGPMVTSGYWHDPERSRGRFVSPAGESGAWYRTGDLGRMDPNGELRFLGRVDNQVKIFSERFELEEIDRVLKKASGAEQAAAVVRRSRDGTVQYVVGFVGTAPAAAASAQARWLEACKRELPPAAVPKTIIGLDEMPLTSNGKIDRARLTRLAEEREVARAA